MRANRVWSIGAALKRIVVVSMCLLGLLGRSDLWGQTTPPPAAVNVTVTDAAGNQVSGFRWLLQEDATLPVTPGVPDTNSLAYNFHRSYMPVVDSGRVTGGQAVVTIPNPAKRYYISVLPDVPAGANCALSGQGCYSIGGGAVAPGQTTATIIVPPQPIPTAQISILAFEDNNPINNTVDLPQEAGLGGFSVIISELAGQVFTDVYGNPLGTVYSGVGADGTPIVQTLGSGVITTMTQADVNDPVKNPYRLAVGEALVKNLAPGKYGVQIVPPAGQNWSQTSTIEGTKGIDAWVKANEPRYFAEFGPAGHHVEIGFVQQLNSIPAVQPGQASGAITGRIVNLRMSRPPNYTFYSGQPLPNCWIGLNEFQLGRPGRGLYAQPCNADSTFSIPNVPAGTYQLVMWDQFLDNIFASLPVTVTSGNLNLNDVPVFRWFGAHEHYVYFDANGNGVRDPGEVGIQGQAINLRFRDGSIYQSFPTNMDGFIPFNEVFPFFNWLVAEVDYLRFKATGVTVTVDAGGPVQQGLIGRGKLNPQIQVDGQPTRTETQPAPVLLEGFQSFLGTTNIFEWGKANYGPGENGGITGIVHYATTRAEDDPRLAAAETWEPGIPRVPVFLYQDDGTGKIKDVNGVAGFQLADVDHYPFGWADGTAPMGPEDVKRNNLGGPTVFNAGDAVQIAATDSWDDNLPTGCPGASPTDPVTPSDKCYDGLRNWNQVRPAVFDGGFAFFTYVPGGASSGAAEQPLPGGLNYIVESVAPKGYLHQKEEDKNVVFGDTSTISPLALPPVCVGDVRTVPAELSLFPGVPGVYAGQNRPLCDRKQVYLANGQNAAADFFLFTEVPIAGQAVGFVLNDVANEFNPQAPTFGEKAAPSWLPVSIRDWTGREISRVYTDEFGTYNALVPTTYTINPPLPSGVSPSMMQFCLNSPGPIKDPATGQMVIDPYFNKQYSQFCYTLNFQPGQTTYLDTPVIPVSAFAGPGNWQLDCECPDKTPRIYSVSAEGNGVGGGPYISATGSRVLSITSVGTVQVPDPNSIRVNGQNAQLIARDFGFGTTPGTVTIGGVALQNVTWTNSLITGTVPTNAQTGELVIRRADSGQATTNSITVHVGNNPAKVRTVAPNTKIQDVLDVAQPGDLILVPPGAYFEMLIMTKPVELQGWGAPSTQINAVRSPAENLQLWREKVNTLTNCAPSQIDLLPGQGNNLPLATGPCGFDPGTGLLKTEEGPGILVATKQGAFSNTVSARIDGFTITGADQSAGIIVNGYARYLEISNNHVVNNQGLYGGGIRLGHSDLADRNNGTYPSAQNDHVAIHHNHISQNGTLFAPGAGVALYTGSDNYQITDNYICGNYSLGDGGGIAHYGLSPNGLIANNQILLNQSFEQTAGGGTGGTGAGGGLLIAGLPQPIGAAIQQSPGAGSVTIVSNLIQGNNAGSSDGGGVLLRSINGQDVLVSPTNNSTWYQVLMFNNMIVNNVAGLAAGGVALQDAAKVFMINNTIAHNDSTATAGAAFTPGNPNQSNPQPAGVVSNAHSPELLAALGAGTTFPRYSDPVLVNNIILHNRSQYWQVDTTVTPSVARLIFSGFDDLAVLPRSSGFRLNPRSSLLTNVNTGYHSSNVLVADSNSATVFVNPYYNAPPALGTVQPDGTYIMLEFTTTLQTAAALDEGGNFIDVHYGPLSPVGDYHLIATSPAIDRGTNTYQATYPLLAADIDSQLRPTDGDGNGSVLSDMGADEVQGSANQAPVITSVAITTATVGAAYSYQVTATDPNPGTTFTYSLTTAPAGMTISATGLISWTPTAAQTGPQAVTVRVQDQGGLFTTQSFTVTVAGGTPLPAGLVAAYAFNEGTGTTVADATGRGHTGTLVGATWTPSGRYGAALVFNGTNARVTVPDAADLDLTTGVTLEAWVYPSAAGGGAWRTVITKDTASNWNYLLYANTDTNQPGMFVGTTFQQQTTGGAMLAANTWTHLTGTYDGATIRLYVNGVQVASRAQTAAMVTNNALLSIGGSGVWGEWFAGRLDELRIYNRALTAAEIQADMATPLGTTANQAPAITSTAVTTAVATYLYNYQVVATDPNAGDTLTYSLTTAPAGMTISATGLISWTPTAAQTGPQAVTVRVQDQGGLFATQSFTVTVAANTAPVITSAAVTTGTVGVAYSYQVVATDANPGTTFTYSLTTAPAGMTINATGLIAWTPTAAQTGPQAVTVRVQDQGGLFATQSFTVTVAGGTPLPAGLVAAYAFNEGTGATVADATGRGHTGTLVGATWTPSGRYGAALVFNGTNARVTVPDAADLDLTTGVTLEAWVYPSAAGGGAWRTVITKDNAANLSYLLYANTDTNQPGMFVGSTFQQQTTGGATLAANTWTHLTGTYDGATIRLYVNGVQVASRAQTAPMATNNDLLSIGGSSVWGEWFAGRLDELRIYNRALTAAEIQADMAAPLP